MSRLYLVVSAVHIFEWMTRTPKLKLIRGASSALRAETSNSAIRQAFPALELCDDAGDIDGVVAVELGEGATGQDAADWADELVRHLSARLPAVDWEAWWAESDDGYLGAYLAYEGAQIAGMSDPGSVGVRTFLPPPLEPPLAETCAGCRREPAQPISLDDDKRRLGADCAARDAAQRRDRKQRSRQARPERKQAEQPKHEDAAQEDAGDRPATPAWTFEDLATEGGLDTEERSRPGRHRTRNHLATIHADGNGIGGLMSALTGAAVGDDRLAGLRQSIVGDIDAATARAFEAANDAVSRNAAVEGAIRHFGGGDDLLASVAAPRAWDFVMVLGLEFQRQLGERLESHRDDLKQLCHPIESLSLGVGITFAHTAHPFADARSLAFDAMKQAKKAVGGARPAVSWIDLTAEDSLPKDRHILLESLIAERRMSNPVAELPPSARSSLGEILASYDDPEPEVARWAKRTGNAVRFENLSHNLSRARWWPRTSVPHELLR